MLPKDFAPWNTVYFYYCKWKNEGLIDELNEITSVLGAPMTYNSHMSEFGLDEGYQYENSWFSFAENGIFVEFNILSDNFVIFEQDNGGIRVGDLISRVTELLRTGWSLEAKPNGMYELWMYDEVMYFRVENDLIVRINYSASL